ncbi:MAG TPA: NosD domain-containing protein [Acidimicrobiales bacterium]|nr:NosD domain-containing protein [Acidimicrobiales bacterium]
MRLKRVTVNTVSASIVAMAGLLVLPSAVFASPARSHSSNAHPPTLYVGTSGTNVANNCQNSLNPCQTISFALSQASIGATIKVQAGTYNEQVKITQPVTIMGAGANQTVIEPTSVPLADADTDGLQPQFYIVDVTGTAGVYLKDLGINGSAATPSLDTDSFGCGQDYVGVYFHDASGSMTGDTVTGVKMPADLFGCQGGLGVYAATDSGSLTPSVLTMTSDNVNNYDKNGITCDDPGTVCNIKGTTVTGIGSTTQIAQNGIQIWAASAVVTRNSITDNTYNGAFWAAAGILIGNPYKLSVKGNTVTNNDSNISLIQDQDPYWVFCGTPAYPGTCTNPAAAGTTFAITGNHVNDATNVDTLDNSVGSEFGDGIDLDSITQDTTVSHNVVDNNAGNGIALLGATKVSAKKNTVRNDYNGFLLTVGTTAVTANANTLQRNRVSSSTNDGFLVTSSTGGNTIVRNSSSLNSSFDAQDNSTGAGTAGTANMWVADACTTSDPSGLCHIVASAREGGTGSKGHGAAPSGTRRTSAHLRQMVKR